MADDTESGVDDQPERERTTFSSSRSEQSLLALPNNVSDSRAAGTHQTTVANPNLTWYHRTSRTESPSSNPHKRRALPPPSQLTAPIPVELIRQGPFDLTSLYLRSVGPIEAKMALDLPADQVVRLMIDQLQQMGYRYVEMQITCHY